VGHRPRPGRRAAGCPQGLAVADHHAAEEIAPPVPRANLTFADHRPMEPWHRPAKRRDPGCFPPGGRPSPSLYRIARQTGRRDSPRQYAADVYTVRRMTNEHPGASSPNSSSDTRSRCAQTPLKGGPRRIGCLYSVHRRVCRIEGQGCSMVRGVLDRVGLVGEVQSVSGSTARWWGRKPSAVASAPPSRVRWWVSVLGLPRHDAGEELLRGLLVEVPVRGR
jgi:hypothetical protein